MTKYEMVANRIEELENNDIVVAAIRLDDNTMLSMEEILIEKEIFDRAIALGTVSVDVYEENGYECDGLEYTWIKL